MMTNSANSKVNQGVSLGHFSYVQKVGPKSQVIESGHFDSPKPAAIGADFFSEYIWGNLMLAYVVATKLFTSPIRVQSVTRICNARCKRTIDIVGSIVGLILSLPFFIVLPILIKLSSPGRVFYSQGRIGHNRRRENRRTDNCSMLGRTNRDRRRSDVRGRPFNVLKFRTMVADAEKKCGPVWATENDPRITRIGSIMRKTRLDEIPQFINVLNGQMSLVGPRPERAVFIEELSAQVENYQKRLDVKPGITGLAQVKNGYDSSVTSVVRKVHYDLQYIQNWSLWQDIKIMLRTVVVVITGKGAF